MAWWELSCMVAVQKKKKLKRCSFLLFFFPYYIIVYLTVRNTKIQNSESTPNFFFNGVLILIQIEKPLANAHVQTETSLENKETTTSLKQTLTFLTVVTTRTQTHMILGDYSLPPWYYGLWSSWAQ